MSIGSIYLRHVSGMFLACAVTMLPAPVWAELTLHVAPQPRGSANGTNATNAADFRDATFWKEVQSRLDGGPVTVLLEDGKYLVSADESRDMPQLKLKGIGHRQNQLTLEAASAKGVVFTRHPDDDKGKGKGPGLLSFSQCHNFVVRNLHFTGNFPIGYATHLLGCQNVLIENCSWIDLQGTNYGATGTAYATTNRVTYRNCVFKRVGYGSQSHMAYNAYGAKHVRFIGCEFEDCAGDYVRFRDESDFGVVAGCTFTSTGTYVNGHAPFITVPLFNDDNPATVDHKKANFEYFGTHFLFCDNTFHFEDKVTDGQRVAIGFHHFGFDPPGRRHLLTREEAQTLAGGTASQRRELLSSNLVLDWRSLHVCRNTFRGASHKAWYQSRPNYGSKSRGWEGVVDIFEVLNHDQVAPQLAQAARFFDR